MNVMILTDLEGISGVDSIDMMNEGTRGNMFARERLMKDVNAAARGAFEGGADKVYTIDGHGKGKNFIKEMLDERVVQIEKPHPKEIKESIDAWMVVGLHAMAGTINGFLDHTQSSKSWYNYYINGQKRGEIAQYAIHAGVFNAPIVMVSGDEAACDEAKLLLGDVECAVVKKANGRNIAVNIDLDEAERMIFNAARNAMDLAGKAKPYKPDMPLEIMLEYYRTDYCEEALSANKNAVRIDARTIKKTLKQISCEFRDLVF